MLRQWAIFIVCILMGCVNPDVGMDETDTTEILFEVPKGSTATGLAPKLLGEGLIPSEFKWKWFLRGEDASCLKAGRFSVNRTLSMRDLLQVLCGAPLADDVPFSVLEGWRMRDIDDALVSKGFIEPGEYLTLASTKAVDLPFEIPSSTLEGYLFPETYAVPPTADRFDPKLFIERQLLTFQERFLKEHGASLGNRSLNDIVIMASLIEREEPTESQRPIVAGILWKRLDSDWRLGVDATSRYGLDDWSDERAFRVELRNPDDPYNTRLHMGLPPTAIGNPSLSALKAVSKPEKSEYWFYLHDSKGVFHGGRDAAHHERNRKRYNVY